jgi:hypothetical protein
MGKILSPLVSVKIGKAKSLKFLKKLGQGIQKFKLGSKESLM